MVTTISKNWLFALAFGAHLTSCKLGQDDARPKDVIISEKYQVQCSGDWICEDSDAVRGSVKATVDYGPNAFIECSNDLKSQVAKISVCKSPSLVDTSVKHEELTRQSNWVTCTSDLGKKFCAYMDDAVAALKPCAHSQDCAFRWNTQLEQMRLFRSRWERINVERPITADADVAEKSRQLANTMCSKQVSTFDPREFKEMITTMNAVLKILERVQISAKIARPVFCEYKI
jgi:hypothetical protein